jgi:hypothetical protein
VHDQLDAENIAAAYWGSELARQGFARALWLPGRVCLLLPDTRADLLAQLAKAIQVIISRGTWRQPDLDTPAGLPDSHEFILDLGSDRPYCLILSPAQSEGWLPAHCEQGGLDVEFRTCAGVVRVVPGKYRIVPTLPWMRRWVEH